MTRSSLRPASLHGMASGSRGKASATGAHRVTTAGFGVLGVVSEGPTHGFAVATAFAADGELGRVWRVPRPVIYRELGRLADDALVEPVGVETDGPGPDRTIVRITAAGQERLAAWLREAVDRPRDARSELLLKLALLDRAGADPAPLVAAQRAVFLARLKDLRAAAAAAAPDSFDRTLALWRVSSTQAILDFLEAMSSPLHGS